MGVTIVLNLITIMTAIYWVRGNLSLPLARFVKITHGVLRKLKHAYGTSKTECVRAFR